MYQQLHAAFSEYPPMTGFRLAQNLHIYSGGTVRDLHPVFYSPAALLPQPQALKGHIHFAVKRIAPNIVFVNGE